MTNHGGVPIANIYKMFDIFPGLSARPGVWVGVCFFSLCIVVCVCLCVSAAVDLIDGSDLARAARAAINRALIKAHAFLFVCSLAALGLLGIGFVFEYRLCTARR